MKKRVLSILLTLVMLIGMMPLAAIPAFAAGDGVPYLDAEGVTRYADNVTEITSNSGRFGAGWYILTGKKLLGTITFTGDAHLILSDETDIIINNGIKLVGCSLTVYAQSTGNKMGKLTANDDLSAGIGSFAIDKCGDITINGGIVTATCTTEGAGIGAGSLGSCGDITVNGGIVTATGGKDSEIGIASGAGIGSGSRGKCGNITINGGVVTAVGGEIGAAGIGTGANDYFSSTCGDITINDGCIMTKRGSRDVDFIGAGVRGSCGNVDLGYTARVEKDGWYCVNLEPFAAVEPTCTEAGREVYFRSLRDGNYYSAYPFTTETLIGSGSAASAWISKGGAGYIAPLWHFDDNGDSMCDRCKAVYYEKASAVQPNCTEAGHKEYFKSLEDGMFYSSRHFTEENLIGNDTALAAWIVKGGAGCIAPLGHVDNNGDGVCDRCRNAHSTPYYDYDPSAKEMIKAVVWSDVLTELTSGGSYGEGWYILKGRKSPGRITFTGDTHLILADGADITINDGIILSGCSLTIYAQSVGSSAGKLTANGNQNCAGIGPAEDGSCGSITVNGGTVTANGGGNSPGIGSGKLSTCGNITVNGGTVTATGGENGAGIGSGESAVESGRMGVDVVNPSRCGIITVNGGTVTATGGECGAGIGSGYFGQCSHIIINGGTVTANGGLYCAGIGSGFGGNGSKGDSSSCENIVIHGGAVTATGGDNGAGIGISESTRCGNITIDGGRVVAIGRGNNAGIGCGYGAYGQGGRCGYITINGGYIKARTEGGPRISTNTGNGLTYAPSCILADVDGWYCVNCVEVFSVLEPNCTEAGHAGYVADYWDDLYYTKYPFNDTTLIGDKDDLAKWCAEGGAGFTQPPLGHLDEDGDRFCDRCGSILYYDYDPENGMTEKYLAAEDATEVVGSTSTLTGGWYIVKGNVEIEGSLSVNGEVHLILADGAMLTVKEGVLVTSGNSLMICAQSLGNRMGSLTATGAVHSAGIGSASGVNCGDITINGGNINAKGGRGAAGIGGGCFGSSKLICIHNGNVLARGGINSTSDPWSTPAPGIGGGVYAENGGKVQITGGRIEVHSGRSGVGAFGSDSAAAEVHLGFGMTAYEMSGDGTASSNELQLTNGVLKSNAKDILIKQETPNDGPVTPIIPGDHTHLGIPQPGAAATENSAGYKDYYECSCGKCFEDAACMVEITDLAKWKAEGGNGYIAPLSDKDDPTSPRTGDNSNIALWMTLFVLSSMVLCCCGIIGRKNEQ